MGSSALKKKILNFLKIAHDLREGQGFKITRLTSIKSLCADPEAANAFCLHLAKLTQQQMSSKECPSHIAAYSWQLYQQMTGEAIQTLETYLSDPSPEHHRALREAYYRLRQLQNEHQNGVWGGVRLIQSSDVVLVEEALGCALNPNSSNHWGYTIARSYAEAYDPRYGSGLVPQSAPKLEDIANFWLAYHQI